MKVPSSWVKLMTESVAQVGGPGTRTPGTTEAGLLTVDGPSPAALRAYTLTKYR